MKKTQRFLAIVLALTVSVSLLAAANVALGADDAGLTPIGDVPGTPDVGSTTDLIAWILKIVMYIIIAILAIFIIIYGLMYMFQGGDKAKRTELIQKIVALIIGLAIVLLAVPLVNIVVEMLNR